MDATGAQAKAAFFCGVPLIQVGVTMGTESSSITETHGDQLMAGGSPLAGGCCRSRSKADVNVEGGGGRERFLTNGPVCLVPNHAESVTLRLCMESRYLVRCLSVSVRSIDLSENYAIIIKDAYACANLPDLCEQSPAVSCCEAQLAAEPYVHCTAKRG